MKPQLLHFCQGELMKPQLLHRCQGALMKPRLLHCCQGELMKPELRELQMVQHQRVRGALTMITAVNKELVESGVWECCLSFYLLLFDTCEAHCALTEQEGGSSEHMVTNDFGGKRLQSQNRVKGNHRACQLLQTVNFLFICRWQPSGSRLVAGGETFWSRRWERAAMPVRT